MAGKGKGPKNGKEPVPAPKIVPPSPTKPGAMDSQVRNETGRNLETKNRSDKSAGDR